MENENCCKEQFDSQNCTLILGGREIEIRKGVPMPTTKSNKWANICKLEVGDSFVLSNLKERSPMLAYAKKANIRMGCRVVDGQLMCWRLEGEAKKYVKKAKKITLNKTSCEPIVPCMETQDMTSYTQSLNSLGA